MCACVCTPFLDSVCQLNFALTSFHFYRGEEQSFVNHLLVLCTERRRGDQALAVDGGNHIGAVVYKASCYGLGKGCSMASSTSSNSHHRPGGTCTQIVIFFFWEQAKLCVKLIFISSAFFVQQWRCSSQRFVLLLGLQMKPRTWQFW